MYTFNKRGRSWILLVIILVLISIMSSIFVNAGVLGDVLTRVGPDGCTDGAYETGDEDCPYESSPAEECKDIFTASTASESSGVIPTTKSDSCDGNYYVSEAYIDCYSMDSTETVNIRCPGGFSCLYSMCVHNSGTTIGPQRGISYTSSGKINYADYITVNKVKLWNVKNLVLSLRSRNLIEQADWLTVKNTTYFDVRDFEVNPINYEIHATSLNFRGYELENVKGLRIKNGTDIDFAFGFTYKGVNFGDVFDFRINEDGTFDIGSCTINDNQYRGVENLIIEDNTVIFDHVASLKFGENETMVAKDVSGGAVDENSSFFFESSGEIETTGSLIVNATDVGFYDDYLYAGHAGNLVVGNSIAGNVYFLKTRGNFFNADSAEIVYTDGLTFESVKNSTFITDEEGKLVYTEVVSNANNNIFNLINPLSGSDEYVEFLLDKDQSFVMNFSRDMFQFLVSSNSSMLLSDGGILNTGFTSFGENSTVLVHEGYPPLYEISNGALQFSNERFSETFVSEGTGFVDVTSANGFGCLNLSSLGAYVFSDKLDERNDFVLHVPSNVESYRICTRKTIEQKEIDVECDLCGIIDFISKDIDLRGTIEYLRYPRKNNEIKALVMKEFYMGLNNPLARLVYENDFNVIDTIFLNLSLTDTPSVVFPNNYFAIQEAKEGGILHTFVKVDSTITEDTINDVLIKHYENNILGRIFIDEGGLYYNNINFFTPSEANMEIMRR